MKIQKKMILMLADTTINIPCPDYKYLLHIHSMFYGQSRMYLGRITQLNKGFVCDFRNVVSLILQKGLVSVFVFFVLIR